MKLYLGIKKDNTVSAVYYHYNYYCTCEKNVHFIRLFIQTFKIVREVDLLGTQPNLPSRWNWFTELALSCLALSLSTLDHLTHSLAGSLTSILESSHLLKISSVALTPCDVVHVTDVCQEGCCGHSGVLSRLMTLRADYLHPFFLLRGSDESRRWEGACQRFCWVVMRCDVCMTLQRSSLKITFTLLFYFLLI